LKKEGNQNERRESTRLQGGLRDATGNVGSRTIAVPTRGGATSRRSSRAHRAPTPGTKIKDVG